VPVRDLRGAVVIANGMESEPTSAKDASPLARAPHLVLDGIALAAETTSARAAYLCVRRQVQADALAAAIAERGQYDPVPVQLALVPERYVASAESSLISRHGAETARVVRYLAGQCGPCLIGLDPWGYPILAPGPVPPDLESLARRTVASYPALALLLEPTPREPRRCRPIGR
jgi:hypothetical protein